MYEITLSRLLAACISNRLRSASFSAKQSAAEYNCEYVKLVPSCFTMAVAEVSLIFQNEDMSTFDKCIQIKPCFNFVEIVNTQR